MVIESVKLACFRGRICEAPWEDCYVRRLTKLDLEQIGDDLCLVFTEDNRKGRGIIGVVDQAMAKTIAEALLDAVETRALRPTA